MGSGIGSKLARIAFMQSIIYGLKIPLEEIILRLDSRDLHVKVPLHYAKAYRSDDRKGAMTGIDSAGRYEHAFSSEFISRLGSSPVLYDVGAAVGFYSILAYAENPGCHLLCFEPDPVSRWILGKNLSAAGSRRHVVIPERVMDKQETGAVSIDSCIDCGLQAPTIIKMDIEGFEYYAVQGCVDTCRTYKPVFLIEHHHRKMRDILGVDPLVPLALLENLGYRLLFNGHHWFTACSGGEVDPDWHESPPNEVNYAVLALHE